MFSVRYRSSQMRKGWINLLYSLKLSLKFYLIFKIKKWTRCHQIGDKAGLCARRREAVVQVEEEMRKQREAQHLARVRGGHLLRRGRIIVDGRG